MREYNMTPRDLNLGWFAQFSSSWHALGEITPGGYQEVFVDPGVTAQEEFVEPEVETRIDYLEID